MTDTTAPSKALNETERAQLAEKLDNELDDFINSLSAKSGKPREEFNFDRWCDDFYQHPAFAHELKQNTNGEYSTHVQALQALKYDDDDDTNVTAENSRVEGNNFVRTGKYRWAIEAYTTGIRARCNDRRLNAVLHANRAAAHRRLGNRGSAVRDCLRAWRFDHTHLKAIFRGAEILLELGHAARCLAWAAMCEQAEVTPSPEDQSDEATVKRAAHEQHAAAMALLVAAATSRRRAEERDERKRAAERRRAINERRTLLAALRERRLRFSPHLPINDVDDDEPLVLDELRVRAQQTGETPPQERVYLQECGGKSELVWPLLLQYVGAGQTDMIADCDETSSLASLLAPVFAASAPWDTQNHDFRLSNVRFFLPLNVLDDRQVKELCVGEQRLSDVLATRDHTIIQGLPIIQVYTKRAADADLTPLGARRFRLR